jgi:hypothetical protein
LYKIKKALQKWGAFFHDDLLGFSTLSCRSLKVSMINLIKMKKGKFILLAVLFFMLAANTAAFCQNYVCDCASYSSLQFQREYETIFPHEKMKSEGIKQVIVYTTGSSSADSTRMLFSKYIELKFNFDADGYVASRIHFHQGTSNYIYEFERNAKKQITRLTVFYLDSLEQKATTNPSEIIDFIYDKKGRLIEEWPRLPVHLESTKNYTKHKYFRNGKLKKTTRKIWYDDINKWEIITSYRYAAGNLIQTSKTVTNGELFTSDSITYNKDQQVLSEQTYNHLTHAKAWDKKYEYNANGQLVRFGMRSGPGGGTECADGGNFSEYYFYPGNGLIERIVHKYGIYTCAMGFEYIH